MEVLSVRVPFHLQVLLAQRVGKQLDAPVADHGLQESLKSI